jgi:hypothetical protein
MPDEEKKHTFSLKREIIGHKFFVVARIDGKIESEIKYSRKKRMKDYNSQYSENRTFREGAKRLTNVYEYNFEQPKEEMPKAPNKKFAYVISASIKGEGFAVSSRYDHWPSLTDAYNEAYERYYGKLGGYYNASGNYDEDIGMKHHSDAKIVWEGVRYYEAVGI